MSKRSFSAMFLLIILALLSALAVGAILRALLDDDDRHRTMRTDRTRLP
jgi:hypothetical protein